jgi:hypothetical protein
MNPQWRSISRSLQSLFQIPIEEVAIMNFHISKYVADEKFNDAVHSIEYFIVMLVTISLLSLVFFAVV